MVSACFLSCSWAVHLHTWDALLLRKRAHFKRCNSQRTGYPVHCTQRRWAHASIVACAAAAGCVLWGGGGGWSVANGWWLVTRQGMCQRQGTAPGSCAAAASSMHTSARALLAIACQWSITTACPLIHMTRSRPVTMPLTNRWQADGHLDHWL